jgi:hypothetical protein
MNNFFEAQLSACQLSGQQPKRLPTESFQHDRSLRFFEDFLKTRIAA